MGKFLGRKWLTPKNKKKANNKVGMGKDRIIKNNPTSGVTKRNKKVVNCWKYQIPKKVINPGKGLKTDKKYPLVKERIPLASTLKPGICR